MEVYIEIVVIDNFIITYLLVKLTHFICKSRGKIVNIVCSASLGTLGSVLYPLLHMNFMTSLLYKLGLGMGICLFSFFNKMFFIKSGVFFLCTFTLGGGLFCINYLHYQDIVLALSYPVASLPIGFILGGGYVLVKFFSRICRKVQKVNEINSFIFNGEIKILDRVIPLSVFLDTGNLIVDNKTNLPVVMVDKKYILSCLGSQDNFTKNLKGGRRLEICSPTGSNTIFTFPPDEFLLYLHNDKHIYIDVLIGLSSMPVFKGYNAVMGNIL